MSREWRFEELKIDQRASYLHQVTKKDVDDFAVISGDMTALHIDPVYARKEHFRDRVVHGMFLGALVSRLVGMELPGKYSLLLSAHLYFKKPVYIGDELIVEGKIRHKSESTRIVDMHIGILRNKETVTEGLVHVRVLF